MARPAGRWRRRSGGHGLLLSRLSRVPALRPVAPVHTRMLQPAILRDEHIAPGPLPSRRSAWADDLRRTVAEADAHAILDRAVAAGRHFLDTAEMYSVPRGARPTAPPKPSSAAGSRRAGLRQKVVLATRWPGRHVAGLGARRQARRHAGRHRAACTTAEAAADDVIDLYSAWPNRNAPSFGSIYFDRRTNGATSVHDQLERSPGSSRRQGARHRLSNETPWGCANSCRRRAARPAARGFGAEPVLRSTASSTTVGRSHAPHRHQAARLLAARLRPALRQVDERGIHDPTTRAPGAVRAMKSSAGAGPTAWPPPALQRVARAHGLTPTRMALAFCYTNWRAASTIVGVTSAGSSTSASTLGHDAEPGAAVRDRQDPRTCATRRSSAMARKSAHVSETPATRPSPRRHTFTEHPYDYVEHGGTAESARQLRLRRACVVKTCVAGRARAAARRPEHVDRQVSTRTLRASSA